MILRRFSLPFPLPALCGLLLGFCLLTVGGPLASCQAADDPAESTPAAATPAAVDAEPPAEEPSAAEGEDGKPRQLHALQDSLSLRYRRFEKTLLQMAEYMRKTDPERADLLVRAIGRSKEDRIAQQMDQISVVLNNKQFGEALERQEQLVGHLRSLLKLLQSEARSEEIKREQARIRDLLKDLRNITEPQRDLRAATERGGNPSDLERRQAKIADDTKRLVEKIDGQDASKAAGEGKEGEGKPKEGEGKPKEGEGKPKEGEGKPKEGEGKPKEGEGKPKEGEGKPKEGEGKPKEGEGKPKEGEGKPKEGEGKPGEGEGKPKEGEGKPGEGEGKPKEGEGKPGEGEGKPKEGEGKPGEGEGKPGEGKPGESQQDEGKTPGRDEIEKARQEMERAIEELKKKNHDDASDSQGDAIAELEKAKEKLEEILRQLREEEQELLLFALEARFQKMLALQQIVYNGTLSLSRTPNEEWTARHFGRSRELSGQETEIAVEALKALTLLKEEGSSVAFPEGVEQLREDMLTVADRLETEQVGEITQGIEKDIIEALQEMIEALQKEMEKKKEEQQQQQQQQQGQKQDPPLVDQLAELKMLRSLQLRVNRATRRLGRLVEGEQATKADVVGELQRLARRQARIQEAAYDLATGKNK